MRMRSIDNYRFFISVSVPLFGLLALSLFLPGSDLNAKISSGSVVTYLREFHDTDRLVTAKLSSLRGPRILEQFASLEPEAEMIFQLNEKRSPHGPFIIFNESEILGSGEFNDGVLDGLISVGGRSVDFENGLQVQEEPQDELAAELSIEDTQPSTAQPVSFRGPVRMPKAESLDSLLSDHPNFADKLDDLVTRRPFPKAEKRLSLNSAAARENMKRRMFGQKVESVAGPEAVSETVEVQAKAKPISPLQTAEEIVQFASELGARSRFDQGITVNPAVVAGNDNAFAVELPSQNETGPAPDLRGSGGNSDNLRRDSAALPNTLTIP